MPLALLAAFAGSLAIHVAALFGADIELPGEDAEPVTLQAELKPLPAPAAPPRHSRPPARPASKPAAPAGQRPPAPAPEPPAAPAAALAPEPPAPPPAATPPLPVAAKPLQPASGVIRYAISLGDHGFVIGRAEHRWEFAADGSYRLSGVTETSGLAALFKPLRMEYRSAGQLGPDGLQPSEFRTLKNGQPTRENVEFDWPAGVAHFDRDGSTQPVTPGTQDILSLNYQLAYLPHPEAGNRIGVVNGRKLNRHSLDSLGEEELDTPAGHFRTLHLRAATDYVTEIWIALDRYRLPVKIRFTDRKGDSYEQVATELGTE